MRLLPRGRDRRMGRLPRARGAPVTEQPIPVHTAWAAVMADVQAIAKKDKNEAQRFLFRGVDAVVNVVGPVLRKHGVMVLPVATGMAWADVQTSTGKAAHQCVGHVTYRVIGPAGDALPDIQVATESMDSGDKATPKAMSVAYRTALLQALCIPTDDPEPDAQTYERAHAATAPTDGPQTERSRGRMFALLGELGITDEGDQRDGMSRVLGREVESRSSLTELETQRVIRSLETRKKASA